MKRRNHKRGWPGSLPGLIAAVLLSVSPAFASKKAIILAGSGGTATYRAKFAEQAATLRLLLLNRFGFAENDIITCIESRADSLSRFLPNDARTIQTTFRRMAQQLAADDAVLIFIFGHGSFDGRAAKLNIDGPDLRDIDFAAMVEKLPAETVLFVNMASASGPFLEKLSGSGRIIITATRNGYERNATRFPDFFLQALESDLDADLNKDGELSVTEAFIFARDNLVRDYEEKKQLRPEHPLLDDNGDSEGTETPDLLAGDGELAAQFLFRQESAGPGNAETNRLEIVLSKEQQKLLEQVRALQAKKNSMPEDVYYQEFEKLMLQLARLKAQKD